MYSFHRRSHVNCNYLFRNYVSLCISHFFKVYDFIERDGSSAMNIASDAIYLKRKRGNFALGKIFLKPANTSPLPLIVIFSQLKTPPREVQRIARHFPPSKNGLPPGEPIDIVDGGEIPEHADRLDALPARGIVRAAARAFSLFSFVAFLERYAYRSERIVGNLFSIPYASAARKTRFRNITHRRDSTNVQ